MTIALSTAAAAAAFTFFPASPVQAYPAVCDTTYRTCIANVTSFDDIKACYLAFESCSGGATPPPVSRVRGLAARH